MAGDVVTALSRFGETLTDASVGRDTKLKVLRTLSGVALTLTELSNSGVGRAVRRLKAEPGELGETAKNLVTKWRALLDEHMKRENIMIPNKVEKPRNLTGSLEPLSPFSKTIKRHASSVSETQSLDASSGLSFEQAMNVTITMKKKPKKRSVAKMKEEMPSFHLSREFTQDILSSLSVSVDRPDACKPSPKPHPPAISCPSNQFEDDGDLKFHSKKVIWAPRVKRPVEQGSSCSHLFNGNTSLYQPPTLVDACLSVIEKNLSIVEYVGQVPYELFSRVLQNASVEDLLRIEKHNPQFEGLTDELWKKHVQRRFPECRDLNPRSKETWAKLYTRLEDECSRRLDQFINRSASKLRAEKESRRTTLMTDVITPAQIRKRISRQLDNHRSHGLSRLGRCPTKLSNVREAKMVFKPRNMSYPTPPSSAADRRDALAAQRQSASVLDKLRKQVRKSR
ncbi:unnamed protein product [Mesocestoides corti]|uniref:Elongin-A n=1 Tax=Mesocestoides corti TaxID=53468 RepID=A0A0R3UQR6_MESCO|nr:unnamed protein product [Mesocestoides corti]